MNNKLQFLVPVAVIIALSSLLLFSYNSQNHFQPPRLPKVVKSEITRLKISSAGKDVEVVRIGDHWEIIPEKSTVAESKIESILKHLVNLELTAIVSESGNYGRYQMDQARAIRVAAFAGRKRVLSFSIGKTASTGHHTFVRLENKKPVYHARGRLRSVFAPDLDKLRDRAVLAFDKDKIERIRIRWPSKELAVELHRDSVGNQKSIWKNSDGGEVETSRVKELLTMLRGLKVSKFFKPEQASQSFETQIEVRLESPGNKSCWLTIYKPLDQENLQPARSFSQKLGFYLDKNRVKLLFDISEKLLSGPTD